MKLTIETYLVILSALDQMESNLGKGKALSFYEKEMIEEIEMAKLFIKGLKRRQDAEEEEK